MAKKVSLPKGTRVGDIKPDNGVVEIGGVRYTPDSARNPNVQAHLGATDPSLFPVVDVHALEPQDANDGTEDGDQPSFGMPPFANGRDMRPGR